MTRITEEQQKTRYATPKRQAWLVKQTSAR
jgi:hypothetical protein